MRIPIVKTLCAVTLVMALAIACARENTPSGDSGSGKVYSFSASLETGARASVESDGKCSWDPGDKIAVWDAQSGRYCTFTSENGDGEFCFTGEPGVQYSFTQAVFPLSAAKAPGTLTLAAEYTLDDAVAANTMVMQADIEGDEINFRHAAALLRYHLESLPPAADHIEFYSAQVGLSGDFSVKSHTIDDGRVHAEGEDVQVVGGVEVKSGSEPKEVFATSGNGRVGIDIVPGANVNLDLYFPLPIGTYTVTLDIMQGNTVLLSRTTESFRDIERARLIKTAMVCPVSLNGSGTPEDPYRIGSTLELNGLSALVSGEASYRTACYSLTADIDMTGCSFRPVGTADAPFEGVFKGNGHSISNLSIISEADNAGLFGYVGAAEISDIKLVGAKVSTSERYAGGIAGFVKGATISGCSADAESTVRADKRGAGCIVGFMRSGTIKDCAAHGSAITGEDCAGGIAGYLNPNENGQGILVINCVYEPVYKEGHLYGALVQSGKTDAYMGGIAGSAYLGQANGDLEVKIVNCYAFPLELRSTLTAGTVVNRVGGIVGNVGTQNISNGITVCNCITPVTYSNMIVGGERVDAIRQANFSRTAAVVGFISHSGAVLDRLYSTNTWAKCYSGTQPTLQNISQKMGDGNMRGFSITVVGGRTYTEAEGGVAAALNDGAAEWNATSPSVVAREWAYDPTFGYPKPVGVDAPGIVTKKVSIIGDSISTYQGYIFSSETAVMSKFYPDTGNNGKYQNMVFNEQYTWWWQLIYDKMNNARLEANNSFGGTCTSYLEAGNPKLAGVKQDVPSRYGVNSLQQRYIDFGLGNPDVVFYFGGRNDFGNVGNNSHILLSHTSTSTQAEGGTLPSTEELEEAYSAPAGSKFDNYSQGTVAILKAVHDKNPNVKILLIITDLMSDSYEDGAEAIRAFLADKGFDIRFANLHKRGAYNTINDVIGVIKENGSHPNQVGCRNVANYIWDNYGSWLNE